MSEVKNRMYYISKDENKFKLLIYQREREREIGKKKRYRPKLLLLLFIITLFTEGNFPL